MPRGEILSGEKLWLYVEENRVALPKRPKRYSR
jgi:hypothetical protein